jgi:hypothetical protein
MAWALFLMVVLVSSALAVEGGNPAPAGNGIVWSDFLSRLDPVWTKLPMSWKEGIMLGNGQIGASIIGSASGVSFTLHRQDVADQRPFRHDQKTAAGIDTARLRIGRFHLRPVGKVTSFKGRLTLWDALNTGTLTTDKGVISWRAFVHATQPLIVFEFTTEGAEKDFAWEWQPFGTSSSRWEGFIAEKKNSAKKSKNIDPDYQRNPPARSEPQGEVQVSVHPLNVGGHFAAAWRVDRPTPDKRVVFATVMPVSEEAKTLAATTVRSCTEPVDSLLVSHAERWHANYPASFVSLGDTRTEAYYWINIYKLYATTRADQPPIDVHGMWMYDSGWPYICCNMNLQLAYYAQATANRLDLAESLCSTLERHTANLSTNIPIEAWRADSVWLGRAADQQLNSSWGAKEQFPANHELANLSWVMEAYWRQCRWSGDDQRLRERFLPLLEKCFNLYRHAMTKGADGKYHLPITVSPEYTQGKGPDSNYDLGAVRWDLRTLIRESERLGINADKIPAWKAFLADVVDYPQDATGLWIAAKIPLTISHRHYSHLIAIYPFAVLDWDNVAERDLIKHSVDHWYSQKGKLYGYSDTGACSMYSLMERADDALAAMQYYLDVNATPNGFYSEGTLEVGFSFCQNVHEMLMQSRNGLIRVFPATPSIWKNVVFADLRTEGAFLVSAAREDGKTRWVRVKSLAGEPCRIRSSLTGTIRASRIDETGKPHEGLTVEASTDGVVTLALKKGETALLYAGDTMPKVVVAPVAADPVKSNYYGTKR